MGENMRGVKKLFLYIDSMQFGGAQRVMNNLADYFVNSGYSVILINDIVPDVNAPEYQVNQHVQRYYLDDDNLQKKNKNFHRISRLRRLIRKEKPDVILSFLGPPNIRMLISSIGTKCKKIVSVRNDPYREYGSGIKRLVACFIFLLADGCVFQTSDAASYFPKSVQRKSKIILNPVNEKFFKISWTGLNKEIAVVGRLQPQKNPLLAVEAFSKIADEFPEYSLVFYGDEELKEMIKVKSIEYCIQDRVFIFGKTPDIEKRLASSYIFLLSSDYEGLPNALMEAMAVGMPVISTDCPCGGPRYLIQNEQQGFLVPCGDAEAIAVAIKKLIMNESLCLTMGKAAKKRAEDFKTDVILFEWKKYLALIIESG